MLGRRFLLFLALLAVLTLLAGGLFHLFNLRFARGDSYPPYSSYRADPLGSRVYYESLDRLGDAAVRRNIRNVERLPEGRGVTLFVFGLPWDEMSAEEGEYRKLEAFVRNGGRLVVTLFPELGRPDRFTSGLGTNKPTFKNPFQDDDQRQPPINLRAKWGFGYEHIPTTRKLMTWTPLTVARMEDGPLPATLTWHSGLVLTNVDPAWRILYMRGSHPVMIERAQGAGSIVIATDSYFVSNEAMRKERAPELLAWLAGASREIIFNETHLGVQEQPGVATLFRRYRLHGGVIALVLLALLFIWKNAASFVPHPAGSPVAAPVSGLESATGFQNLLRRSLAPGQLLQTSLDEWHKSAQLDGRITPPRRDRIQAVVASYNQMEKPNVVDAYREIAAILNGKK